MGRDWQEAAGAASQNGSNVVSLAEIPALGISQAAASLGTMPRVIAAILLLFTALTTHAVELVSGPKVTQSESSAAIVWRTDVACGTRVSYGTNVEKLDQKVEGGVTDDHFVTLENLTQGMTYFYKVGSARQQLGAGSFTFGNHSKPGATMPPKIEAPKSMLEKLVDALSPETPKAKTVPTPSSAARAPPARVSWGYWESLQDHYNRHGADFQSQSPEDYAAQAWHFLQRAKAGQLQMKWDDADETLRVYDPKTRAFAAYNRNGTTKTYFRPNSQSYWQRQPGKLIQPVQLPFK